MKMARDHLVPLTPQSKRILADLKAAAGSSEWIAPGLSGPMSQNTMIYALYRMGYHGRATIHGLRGTASTICNESGLFDTDWIEKQLAHDEDDNVRAAYNAAEYLEHRIKMMQWWSDYLDAQAQSLCDR